MNIKTKSYSLSYSNNIYNINDTESNITYDLGNVDDAYSFLVASSPLTPNRIKQLMYLAKRGETAIVLNPLNINNLKQSNLYSKINELTTKSIKRIIVVYPGRFQPMGKHHVETYNYLANYFGANNVFIATSNVVNLPNSPFTFNEKKKIANFYGIKNIVKVANPYKANEIISIFDPETTAIVYVVGKKDLTRLRIGNYFKIYPDQDLKLSRSNVMQQLYDYTEHGYILIAPHISISIGGEELSGTSIRQKLGDRTIGDNDKKNIFKQIFGKYTKSIYDLIVTRLENLDIKYEISATKSNIVDLLFENKLQDVLYQLYSKYFINNQSNMILEGGAYGHMMHLWDDYDLTFGEIKDIIKIFMTGGGELTQVPVEKTDGINMFMTWIDGKVKVARNKSTLKNPVSISDIKIQNEIVKKYLVNAINDIEKILSKIDDGTLTNIFNNGSYYMNMEIIHPDLDRLVYYGNPIIQFHGLVEVRDGNIIKYDSDAAKQLAIVINKIINTNDTEYNVEPPRELVINKQVNFDIERDKHINNVNKLQQEYKLDDNNSVGDFIFAWWYEYIHNIEKFKSLDDDFLAKLIYRWGFSNKSLRLSDIKKQVGGDIYIKILEIENNLNDINKIPINIVSEILTKFSINVLKNTSGFLTMFPSKSLYNLNQLLIKSINNIKSSNNEDKIKKLNTLLLKLETYGGVFGAMDNTVPAEGIVFNYKNKIYKLTGLYGILNAIIGLEIFDK
jgi:hypothetical protein